MKNKKRTTEWLVIFIILILMFTIAGTYAFLNIQEYYEGTFEVEVRSKGIDVFTFENAQDVNINVTGYNFSKGIGHNVVGTATINPTLDTSNEKAKVCYEMNIKLPDDEIFVYSNGDNPEVVLDVTYSTDGVNFVYLIEKQDITSSTGTINIPNSNNGDDYKFVIEATRRKKKRSYFKASITFIYYEDIDQSVNDNKTYNASLNANVVEC